MIQFKRFDQRFITIAALGIVIGVAAMSRSFHAQEKFKDLVGKVDVKNVAKANVVQVPYITWGRDVATFLANSGMTTKPKSIYQGLGLEMQLVSGDDFVGQVKRLHVGKTPFLRGTMHMLSGK